MDKLTNNKLALEEDRSTQGLRQDCGCDFCEARNEAREHKQRQHSGNETREDEDYLTHEDPRGAGGNIWELGRQSDT